MHPEAGKRQLVGKLLVADMRPAAGSLHLHAEHLELAYRGLLRMAQLQAGSRTGRRRESACPARRLGDTGRPAISSSKRE